MNTDRLQELIDLARAASAQRWRLGFLSVVSATVAAVAAGFGIGPFLMLMVMLPAVIAVIRAGSQTAIAVIVIVLLEWLGTSNEVTSPSALVIALALFVFHTTLALLATTPHSTGVEPAVLRRWIQRSTVVAGATIGVWSFVLVLEQREPPANGFLVLVALSVLAAAAWMARSRSLAR